MKARPGSSPLRRFLRGLTNTCLLLLLPVQLGLAWLADHDGPVRLPDFVTEAVTERLAAQGVDFRTRALWVLPDLTLAGDDVTVGFDGLTGDVFAAARAEVALHPARLLAGEIAPTRLRLNGGRLWCPASVAQDGRRRSLIDDLTVDIAQEGRWVSLRIAQARAGKITCHVSGEVPARLLRAGPATADAAPLPRRLAGVLGALDAALTAAEGSGGATVTIRCSGRSDGTAELSAQALLGEETGEQLGRVSLRGLRLSADARLAADGVLRDWRLAGEAETTAWRDGATVTAARAALRVRGAGLRGEIVADAALTDVLIGGILCRQMNLRAGRPSAEQPWTLGFRAHTAASVADGSLEVMADGARRLRIGHAVVSGQEISTHPSVAPVLLAAGIDLRGDLLLREAEVTVSPDGLLLGARGEAGLSGFRGLGLSAEAISPDADLPLRTRFDFAPGRVEQPLRLRDLRLASVVGEADCAVAEGGAFRLTLHGELAPASLDRVLGNWWIDLWRSFLVRENPYAFIEVQGHWGALTSRTRGRVLMRNFDFMGAPFRRVEVGVDADERRTLIGLHRLQGGTSAADGEVEGSATWDWSKPGVLAGPVVEAAGDLQPWIAARCAGKSFGDALQGLVLPAGRRFALELRPLGRGLDIRTTIESDAAFKAWGIAGRGLRITTQSQASGMQIDARLGLAGGEAALRLDGDPWRQTDFVLSLKDCDPAQIGQIMHDLGEPSATVTTKAEGRGRLDLDLKGRIDLAAPRELRGLGTYTLNDPELKKVRLLGGISGVLEAVGVGATTYELDRAAGTFGCVGGRAYFPDMTITGPQARLDLAGEVDLREMTLNFAGDFSLPRKQGFNPLDIINLNRALVSLTKIKLQGPLAKPETRAIPTLKDIVKPQKDNDLGKIPAGILE
ncbi:MAG: hypothetical protein RI969_506 [Verrucomicrobiota bacterium]|jgi:hypothetical protein